MQTTYLYKKKPALEGSNWLWKVFCHVMCFAGNTNGKIFKYVVSQKLRLSKKIKIINEDVNYLYTTYESLRVY